MATTLTEREIRELDPDALALAVMECGQAATRETLELGERLEVGYTQGVVLGVHLALRSTHLAELLLISFEAAQGSEAERRDAVQGQRIILEAVLLSAAQHTVLLSAAQHTAKAAD